MKCLVTGATGFLGTNLVHELVKKDWKVRALYYSGKGLKYISPLPVELVQGDLTNPGDAEKAVEGVDVVFNLAGDTSAWKKVFDRQYKINVVGPVNLAHACCKHGVKRVVHTSTVNTLGYNPHGIADETWPHYNYTGKGYYYADTKREGEKKILEFQDKGLEVVVVYPGAIIGPYDFNFQYGRLFFDLRDKKIPANTSGGLSCSHVTEVAKAHIAAAINGKPGEGYICGGINTTHKKLFEVIAAKMGVEAPRYTLPKWVVVPYGFLMESISMFTNKEPSINPGVARHMSNFAHYDSSKAVRELDYKIVSLQKMVDDCYDWYVKEGFIKS